MTGDETLPSCRHAVMPLPTGGKKVESIIDTWRIDDEWWRALISRRYVEVVLEGGGHVVLFENLVTGSWFLQMP